METQLEVSKTIEHLAQIYSGVYDLNDNALHRLYSLCNLMDSLADEFGADEVQYTVDPNRRHGYIHVELTDLEFSGGRNHYFFNGIKDADYIGFETSHGNLKVNVGVEHLWVKI